MKITFAAMVDGTIVGTRSSDTRPHAAVLVVWSERHNGWTDLSWHLTHEAAHKAANAKYVAARYPRRQVVDAVPVKLSGMVLPGSPNFDVWHPLAEAAMAYSSAEQGRKRDAALAEALADDVAPADDVDVAEPIVSISAAGDAEPVDGLRRPIVKATREAMAACAAVGLTYWSDHPTAGMVWAVDDDQHAHPVHIDRKHGTAAIGDYELSLSNTSAKRVVGDSPYVPWSIDGPSEPVLSDGPADAEPVDVVGPADAEGVTIGDMLGALGDRATGRSWPTSARPSAKLADAAAIDAQRPAEPVATDAPVDGPAPLSVTARKAVLANMLADAIDKMIANANDVDRAALAMSDDQIHGQIKMWLRRSGRALIYGDGKGVTGDTDAD